MKTLDSKLVSVASLLAALLVGGSSMLLLAVFLWRGPLGVVDFGWSGIWGGTIVFVWDAGLSLLFFVQHSWMIRRSFKDRWLRSVPEHLHRAWYTIASGIVLFAVVLLWQESPRAFAAHSGTVLGLVYVAWILGIGIGVWGIVALRSDMLGADPIVARLRGRELAPPDFTVRGPYRLIRHPLYLACLLIIWSGPHVGEDRFLFDVLWTAWIVVGSLLEERDLEAEFGEKYRRYRKGVPMLIPWRGSFAPRDRGRTTKESNP